MTSKHLLLTPGTVVWGDLGVIEGKEQAGRRPLLILASRDYLGLVKDLVIVMPVTTVDRGWPNHVSIRPSTVLPEPSWVMTEQVRTVSRTRLQATAGVVSADCLAQARRWFHDFCNDSHLGDF